MFVGTGVNLFSFSPVNVIFRRTAAPLAVVYIPLACFHGNRVAKAVSRGIQWMGSFRDEFSSEWGGGRGGEGRGLAPEDIRSDISLLLFRLFPIEGSGGRCNGIARVDDRQTDERQLCAPFRLSDSTGSGLREGAE